MKKVILFLSSLAIISFSYSQIDVGGKLRDKLRNRADQKVDEVIYKGLDKTEEEVKKSHEKEKQKDKTQKNDNSVASTNNSVQQTAQFASYSKFDFVAGEKVVFYDDFSQDNVGDFPVKWNTNGSGEVVTNNLYPGKWLKMRNATTYLPQMSSAKFPENYTLEYDMIANGEDRNGTFNLELTTLSNKDAVPNASDPSGAGLFLTSEFINDGITRYIVKTTLNDLSDGGATTDINDATIQSKPMEKFHVSIAVNKQRFRYYVNQVKVLDLPRVLPTVNYNAIIFRMWGWVEDHPFDALISNVRYAEGIYDMRSKLMTEGKLVTRGILFDVNSDKIKPESYGALKDISKVLNENAGVKVKIVGHTDSDGTPSGNLDLSKRRATAIKNTLIKEFAVDGVRLETDGKGQSDPASPNSSSEGKANNRRVEFIKL